MITKFRLGLLVIALATGLCAGIYVAGQQILRIGANDPQIQIAEDTARALSNGAKPESMIPGSTVEVSESLATFINIYDSKGEVVAGSGLLHKQYPHLPEGTFDYTKTHGEDRFTWQPESEVRGAVVLKWYGSPDKGGVVMVGRSLKEVELRESSLLKQVGVAWAVTVLVSIVIILV